MVIYLHTKWYKKIWANSMDGNLRAMLYHKLDQIPNNDIKRVGNDWLVFSQYFRDLKFDLILITGNFLSRLLNEYERTRAVQQCFTIFKPGGIFIVDNRNYAKIFHYTENDVISYSNFYEKFYNGRSFYSGTQIRGWPKSIGDKVVEFAIGSDTFTFQHTFNIYHFRGNTNLDELRNLLLCVVGFKEVDIYGDYDLHKCY
jgi:SAM-dependent methyltransferase